MFKLERNGNNKDYAVVPERFFLPPQNIAMWLIHTMVVLFRAILAQSVHSKPYECINIVLISIGYVHCRPTA